MVEDIVNLNAATIAHLLCNASLDPLLICDINTIVDCTESVAIILGYENKQSILQTPLKEFLHRHFLPKLLNANGENQATSILDLCFCHVNDPSTNSSKVVSVKVKEWSLNSTIYYSVGIKNISAFSSVTYAPQVAPIHELSRKQKLMEEFELLADSLPCMIWCLTGNGDAEYYNSKVHETLGLTVGGNWEACMHPEDWKRFAPLFIRLLKEPAIYTIEIRYRHYSHYLEEKQNFISNSNIDESQYRWYLLNSVPIFEKNTGRVVRWVTTATDVHDHKKAEQEKQELILAQKASQTTARMKSEFIAMMSHEIRTPIFGIVGNVCMLMETIIDSDQLALLEHTNESARNLMSVIEDILDFQRVESGKLTIESIPFNIKDVLGQLNKIFMPKALGKSLEFEISPIEKVIPTLGDPNRLSQLLSYLLSNAIKFTFNGSVKLETKFKHLDQENLLFEFTIIDSGIGISSKVLPSIFSPWIQADTSKRRAFGGTGLGLAITKSLVELMKGKISVNSEVNMGTKIVVEIPLMVYKVNSTENRLNFSLSKLIRHQTFRSNMRLCLGTSNQLPYPTNSNTIVKSPSRSKSSRGSKSVRPDLLRRASSNENNTLQKLNINGQPKIFQILIAEDNPVNQAILKRYLQKMGDIEVTMVGDGQAALDAYYAKPKGGFHVILLDQSMPKKDGDEVCREIRKVDSEQIIISVSANVLLADQEHFLSLGMNDHISKPVIYNNFQSVLRKWLHVAQNGKYRDQTSTTSIDEFEAESTDKSSNSNSAPASFKA